MKFKKFLLKHWKSFTAVLAVLIATTVGVVIVKAATVSLSVDVPQIVFTNTSQVVTVNAQATIIGATSVSGTYVWTMADQNVASVTYMDGVGTVKPLKGGKTKLTVGILVDTYYDSKDIPITVPLTIDTTQANRILRPGDPAVDVSCNAASSKNVEWSSSNSSIATVTANGVNASITPVSGGKVTITALIPEDGLSASFELTVGVSIDETEVTVEQGETVIVNTNSNSVSDVYWWSENNDVATVENAVITGVYAGSANVYASCLQNDATTPGAGDSVLVTVPYRIKVPDTTVLVGDQLEISTTAKPSEVNYSSSNNNVLSYDSATGKFTAMATGTADVTVNWNGHTDIVTVTVMDGFSLSNTSVALNIGQTASITALVSNSASPVHWKVADPTMAKIDVSDDGLTATVTALAVGSTSSSTSLIATQEINGVVKTATCEIIVLKPVQSLALFYNGNEIKDTVAIEKGTGIYITAILNFGLEDVPDNTKLSWVSSDDSVISLEPVQSQGQQQLCKVTGKKGGSATITVVSEDGLFIATADIYVTEGIKSITLDKTEVTAQMALQRYQLKATILPQSAGVDTTVVWATLDPKVLTVDQNGLVTFVGPGETYVSATAKADSTKVAYCKFIITQQVEGVKMDFDRVTLSVGDEYRLTAVITPDNATNKKVSWSSSNTDVVKVDDTGMLTAIASGSATIVVQTEDGGYIDMTNVTVLQPVTGIQLSQTEVSVKKGTVFWLDAEVLPETADNKKVTWSSSDTSMATVDKNGKVTTLNVGTVTIACVSEDNGTVAYCVVEITEPVTGLELNAYHQEMVAGTKFVIIPTVYPIDALNKDVTFESSDPAIASVDDKGIVTANIGGRCDIIVTTVEGGLKKTCTINVKEYVESIKITNAPKQMNVNQDVYLKTEVKTDTASDKSIYWTSSNTSVASVDQNGHVTAHKAGNVVITATAADGGGVSDSAVIRVIIPVSSIKLSKNRVVMYVGDTENVSATINPSNASIKGIKWYSDDENIAKVYQDGDIVGINAGRTMVHAMSTDGNKVIADCTVIVKEIIRASSISINSHETVMLKGKTRKLTARLYPLNTHEGVNWLSTDTSIVQVDPYGNIVTVGAGVCEVIAYSSAGTVEDRCKIYSLAMHYTNVKMEQYDTFNLYVDGAPEAVSWRTSNPRVATVSNNGLVTARMPGECTINATVRGKTVSCYIKVVPVDPDKFINVRN